MTYQDGDWDQLRAAGRPTAPERMDAANAEVPVSPPPDDGLPREAIADRRANRWLRQTYARRAYGMAAVCIGMWMLILAIQGGIKALTGIELWSDQVLIAVTTGVTVSVLAAFLGVIRGLFPGKDEPVPAPP